MFIKTKLNVQDYCWFVVDHEAIKGWVTDINISVKYFDERGGYTPDIQYAVRYTRGGTIDLPKRLRECHVHATKEELLKSL